MTFHAPAEDVFFPLGRLAVKYEAAGKVRVFAMVDALRQGILKPIHNCLMNVLRHIPMDGTFNQVAPVHRLMEKRQLKHFKKVFRFDVSDGSYAHRVLHSFV